MKPSSTLHSSRSTAKDALLEIGSEELPASFISTGMEQLKSLAQRSLMEHKIAFKGLKVFGTPRRLSILIQELADRSEDQHKLLTGPPEAIAKDSHGGWTPAALGFARKQNVKPADLRIENGKVTATLHIKGTPARQLLAELFPLWIKKLEFPKSMTWEPSHFRYPRPLRWLVGLYGSDPVGFSLAGVRSSRFTYGLYLQSAKKIQVASAGKYETLLQNHCVLLEPQTRIEGIRKLSEQAVRRVHGRVMLHEGLLHQVANLVEHPVAVVGTFDASYLELPPEVLVTCLEHHQKYFPIEAEKGHKLLPHFVGIRNGMSVHQDIVREGYERVLTARLADARFFFQNDRKTPLSSRVESLKGVIFQQKLGSLFEKKERVKHVIETLAPLAHFAPEDQTKALRVAELGKADLVTDIVREFPELQGIMARIYALADGEDPVLSQALEQHYWPITLSGVLPETPIGALVSLADKLDTLAGDFAVGLIPTGSADPYGLRRAAVGVLRLLETFGWSFPLEELLRTAIAVQPLGIGSAPQETQARLDAFFRQRWSALCQERGYKADEIEAVVANGMGTLKTLHARLEALHKVRKQKEFEPLAAAFKRAMNIVRQSTKSGAPMAARDIQDALLQEPSEKALYQLLLAARTRVDEDLSQGRYAEALAAIVPLREPLDAFFASVMVMAEDPALRANRLALMQGLVELFTPIADFSKIQNA